MFNVSSKEIINGAVNAVVAAVVVGLYGIVTTSGFDVFQADWSTILKSVINWAFAGFIGSFGKNFLTNSEGKILGVQVK